MQVSDSGSLEPLVYGKSSKFCEKKPEKNREFTESIMNVILKIRIILSFSQNLFNVRPGKHIDSYFHHNLCELRELCEFSEATSLFDTCNSRISRIIANF